VWYIELKNVGHTHIHLPPHIHHTHTHTHKRCHGLKILFLKLIQPGVNDARKSAAIKLYRVLHEQFSVRQTSTIKGCQAATMNVMHTLRLSPEAYCDRSINCVRARSQSRLWGLLNEIILCWLSTSLPPRIFHHLLQKQEYKSIARITWRSNSNKEVE